MTHRADDTYPIGYRTVAPQALCQGNNRLRLEAELADEPNLEARIASDGQFFTAGRL